MPTASLHPSPFRLHPLKGVLVALLLFASLGAAPCGYKQVGRGGSLPKNLRTIAVRPLTNQTLRYRVEQKFTAAISEEILKRRLPVTLINDPTQADAVVGGEVKSVVTGPALIDNRGLARIYSVTIRAGITLRDQTSNKVLFDNQNIEYRGEYEFSADPRSFFNEEDPAVDRIARDFARSVVTSMLEGF